MAPIPQEYRQPLEQNETVREFNGDSVVISGMSGLFPMSDDIVELTKILYSKINPVNSDNVRWKWNHPEASSYTGKVSGLDRFDSQFFMVHNRLGDCMDPMARKALEQSFQAIYDAGISPKQISGKKIGVFIATASSETEIQMLHELKSASGYKLTGSSKTMYANRISYWLNLKGPSMTLDDACCGSTVALEQAYQAINSGMCEAAIVGGTNLCLLPQTQVHFSRCIKVSPGSETKSFDENACGCTKSDAITVLFLQKAKDALRAYSEIVFVKNEFISRIGSNNGEWPGFHRNSDQSIEFLKQFYSEAKIEPQAVEYVEAFGSATPEADKAELQAIEKIFCDNREDVLPIGSVISNIGFTGAASGNMAIIKVLLAYHHGLIASNLHCSSPRQDVAALREGRMQVVTEHRPFRGTYAAVNCLSVTGVNSHVLLRGCSKPKDSNRYQTSFPRLVTLSARQEGLLNGIFQNLKCRPIDPEEIALLYNIHSTNITGHLGRGYIILDTDKNMETISLVEKSYHSNEAVRPLWFVYSGMGSQWAGMGAQLMRIPIFAAAIERCRKVLEPRGIDIVHIITSPDKTIFDNVLNSFVGIAAIQIGITDILSALGLYPDKIIGHSVGELGCAYADGCLTSEEMILSAYFRGKASNESPLIRGAMAAVGLGHQQLSKLCPPTIDIACHNSSSSCTISGPEKNIQEFVDLLTANGVFAKEVPSANIAYHSRYIVDAAPHLLHSLSEVIKEPRARSERWLSTSVPPERWDEPSAKLCSPEYLTNNLLSSVYFEETSQLIPANAVLVEVAPHGLLQAILKRALPDSCTNIPLTQRGHKDNALFLLDSIGKLFIEGFTPQLQAIYPKVQFPVSTGTPHLSPFVKWNHTDTLPISGELNTKIKLSSSCLSNITLHDVEHSYLKGNIVQGKILYPFAGALVAVWDTLAMALGVTKKTVSVRFYGVHLYSQPILHEQKLIKLNVSLHRGSGRFEVSDGVYKVATGYIATNEATNKPTNEPRQYKQELMETPVISSDDFYQHLNSCGYQYREDFRTIHTTDDTLSVAELFWTNNWVTLIDGMIQLNAARSLSNGVVEPEQIRELFIDINKHQASIQQSSSGGSTVIKAEVDEILDCTTCGGISLQNLKFRNVPLSNQDNFEIVTPLALENYCHNTKKSTETNVALRIGSNGNLNTLQWEETPTILDDGVKVTVEYAGITTLDMKRATGVLPYDSDKQLFGMEFSGLTDSGDRVMGIIRNGAARRVLSARAELLWPVPTHWTLEEAATVPLAYLQALYCLCVRGELKRGSRVLVHGAAGALGQAAVAVALAHGAIVFATVGDQAKKRFLLRLFPGLNEDAIGSSRDATFGDMVLNATNGEGCDIVLSCVHKNLKNISLKCAAFSGVTFDMAQIQDREEFDYGMFNMTKSRSYRAHDLYTVLDFGNSAELSKLQQLLSSGISTGTVRPLSRVTFPPHEAARAFRLLAGSRHRGRVLLRLHDPQPRAIHRVVCSSYNSHLIVWDGDQFGLQLVDRLIACGAKKIRIYCVQAIKQHPLKLKLWQKQGINVKIIDETLNGSNVIYAILNETSQCGPVEGIYVTACSKSQQNNELINIIDNLDSTSRILCPLLRYFAVISVDCNIGKESCVSRSENGLPATALSLYFGNSVNTLHADVKESSWRRCAVEVTEKALLCNTPVISAQLQPSKKQTLFELIPLLSESNNDDITLQDLGIFESMHCIKSYLRDVCHISLNDDDIYMLTKKQILAMEINISEIEIEKANGLNMLYSHVDDDELTVNTQVFPMNTLVYNIETMDNVIDESRTSLFIIPGVEGHHARFRTLCERLKLPAFVLQPGLDVPNETPREQANRYAEILLEQFKLQNNFYILGYECGVLVALELTSILEDHGLTGTVYCLGSSPSATRALLERELESFSSEDALQEGVVRHMYMLMTRGSAAPVESALRGCHSWSERVDACLRTLRGRVPHSVQYARALLDTMYARITTVRNYRAAPRQLRSRLVLLRASGQQDENELQLYTTHTLIVENLAAPMAYTTSDLRVPAIVNKYLDEDLLEIYNNVNLCHPYLIKQ